MVGVIGVVVIVVGMQLELEKRQEHALGVKDRRKTLATVKTPVSLVQVKSDLSLENPAP